MCRGQVLCSCSLPIELISVSFCFLQAPMSVRSGKFSVSEWTKNSRLLSVQQSVRRISRKMTSRFPFLALKVSVQAAIRLSLTLQNQRQRVRAQSVWRIERDVDGLLNNHKQRNFAPESLILKTPQRIMCMLLLV